MSWGFREKRITRGFQEFRSCIVSGTREDKEVM
jgi:hypothetical protein